jgi:dimeric dUTPase (all-alpha-NTP-PPase superfamily)
MNLTKLFESQRALMERIEQEHPAQSDEGRFNKKILALLVEIGECANEWRGFKYWSKDQKPRTSYNGFDRFNLANNPINPLLEEYVDGLHFVLELGLELNFTSFEVNKDDLIKLDSITQQFKESFKYTLWVEYEREDSTHYADLLHLYLGLGEMIGFTWEEIEQAYYAKNQINHQRQESGY